MTSSPFSPPPHLVGALGECGGRDVKRVLRAFGVPVRAEVEAVDPAAAGGRGGGEGVGGAAAPPHPSLAHMVPRPQPRVDRYVSVGAPAIDSDPL